MSREIWVDADGCPRMVLQTCIRLAEEYEWGYWTVANHHHEFVGDRHLVVDDAPQSADLAIANRVKAGDIVVTQDQGLAALVLGKKAIAIGIRGEIYDSARISLVLEMRASAARFRRGGGKTKGPKKRSTQDEQDFEKSLRRLLSGNEYNEQ